MGNINNKTLAILLCGPREAGKDKAIEYIINQGINLSQRECKDVLHVTTQAIFQIDHERYWEIYNDRKLKEKPLPEFTVTFEAWESLCKIIGVGKIKNERYLKNGRHVMLSIRQAVILVSECLIKPTLGKNWFGVRRAAEILDGEIIVDGSAAFLEEIPPLVQRVGMDNILLIRIKGRGTFEGDSRSFIPDGLVKNTIDVYNNTTEQEYLDKMYSIVTDFINQRRTI